MFLKGQSHRELVGQTNLALVSSTGISFGVFNVAGYSRLSGFVSCLGSATLTYKWGISSGTTFTTSGVTCNSGPTIVDVLVYGKYVDLSFSAANSQTMPAAYVCGEPIR